MVAFEQRMSLCHLAPTQITYLNKQGLKATFHEMETKKANATIICTYCRKPCDFVPNFNLDQFNIEMTLHRFKEGQYSTEDAVDAIQEVAKRALVDLLDKVGKVKYSELGRADAVT